MLSVELFLWRKIHFQWTLAGGRYALSACSSPKWRTARTWCLPTLWDFWYCIARLADAIRTIVWNSCAVTIRLVGFMTSATISTSVRMVRWRSTVSCWRWGLMPDLIIDALSASAMREGSMSKASLATPWPLSRKRDSLTFSGIWRFSFRKRRLWAIGTCLGLLQRSVRVWMLEAGLPDTALINSYNSFWLALLAFTFCHGFAVVSCNSGRNLWLYICLFHHANQVRFLMSFIWLSI